MTEAASRAGRKTSKKDKAGVVITGGDHPSQEVESATDKAGLLERSEAVAETVPAAASSLPVSLPATRKSRAMKAEAERLVVDVVPDVPAEAKTKKIRLVRDSFTMPESEYAAVAALKARCLNSGVATRKSEILRAAIAGLVRLSDTDLVEAIQSLAAIKTGRPAKGSK